MTKRFYIGIAVTGLIQLSFVSTAMGQEQTPPPAPTGGTDQSEEDWRNQNKNTTSDNPLDPSNPIFNGTGLGNLPPIDEMDTLPEESQKHLKRLQTQAIIGMDPTTGEPGNVTYTPSEAAKADPSVQVTEEAVFAKMMGDLKKVAGKGGQAGSGPQQAGTQPGGGSGAGNGTGTGSGGGGQAQPNPNQQQQSGPVPGSVLAGGANRSASEMMRGGGSANGAPVTNTSGAETAEQQAQQQAQQQLQAQQQAEQQAQQKALQKARDEAQQQAEQKARDQQARDQQAREQAQQSEQMSSAQPEPTQQASNETSPSQPSKNQPPEQTKPNERQAEPQTQQAEQQASKAPQQPEPKPGFMSFLKKILGMDKAKSKKVEAPLPESQAPPAQPDQTSEPTPEQTPPTPEQQLPTEPASSQMPQTDQPVTVSTPVQTPSAPPIIPANTPKSIDEMIDLIESDNDRDLEALQDLIGEGGAGQSEPLPN